MSAQSLTAEQEAFLDECLLEFSDRYTDADIEYKKTYDTGIPPPPIMHPWYGRPKSGGNRDRAGGSYRSGGYRDRGDREHRYENNYRDRNQDDREYRRHDNRNKFRPYL